MVTTRWWWIRHAPVISPPGRIYGQRDVPADTSNAAAFAVLAARVPHAAAWYATTLQRTQKTAAAIHAAMAERGLAPPPVAIEAELIEQNFGDWQGRTYDEVGAYGHGSESATGHKFWLAPAQSTPPGGESFVDVMARVSAAIGRLTRAHAGQDVVAVAHGGTIRAAVAHALDLHPEAALALSVDTLSVTRLEHIDGPGAGHGWRTVTINLPAQ
ncbi:MAG: histidine phosphatase family protein [Rhodospirillales bacterium]|nr:histidine phosphatase family protein [Rhodospirillales bacterium]